MGTRDNSNDRLNDFRPRIGRTDRARERVGSSPLGVATLVRRGHGRLGAGRRAELAPTAGFGPRASARRVVVKAHIHKLGGHGAQAAARHLRYIERDGVEKDGSPGVLYGPEGPAARETFEQPRLGERHQFRFIVSPEDAGDLDLTDYVRELMRRVEGDLGRSIEWAAVNHHDTDHPHAHVLVRGVCKEGRPLRMDRTYIARGLRWSAQELATERLGPRPEREIQRTREREVHQERFTSLDREIEQAATERRVDTGSLAERRRGPEPTLLLRRLRHLEGLGLAAKAAANGWVLAEDWQRRLRDLGERGDILKEMHRALHGGDAERFHVVRPGQGLPDGRGGVEARSLVGRVVRKGLGDELHGRTFYAVIETPMGDAYHLTVAARAADALRVGDLVSVRTHCEPAVQPVDRHLAEVAAARGGVYELAGDAAGRGFARLVPRRVRELARAGLVPPRAAGQWSIPSDLLEQLEKRHREAPARYRVSLEAQSLGLDAQVVHRGPVWLDTQNAEPLATKGLGADVRAALERRRHVLRELGIAPDDPRRVGKIADLEPVAVGREMDPQRSGRAGRAALSGELTGRRELARQAAGETLVRETGMTFLRTVPEGFVGRVQARPAESGHLAVSDGVRFVLIPATPGALALAGRPSRSSAMPRRSSWTFGHGARTAEADRYSFEASHAIAPRFPDGASPIMSPTASPTAAVLKTRRVRIYTRMSQTLRRHLLAYCAATGRSERAVIEDAVARYLANPAKDPSTSGPLDRLAQAIDEDRRVHERQRRDLEILSEAFGRFLRVWTIVHAPTFTQPATPEAAEALSRQRASGEALYKRFAANVADQFLRGHRFVQDLPGLEGPRSEGEGAD